MKKLPSLAKCLFYLCIVLWLVSWFMISRLPDYKEIKAELYQEPQQTSISEEKFTIDYKGVQSTVKPVATYEIWGLVVSHNEPSAWYSFDLTHDDKSLDTRDLCVVWGDNLKTNDYRKITYHNDDYSCGYRWSSGSRQFSPDKFSNNHLITDSEAVRRSIAKVNIGDQIHITGKLVNYSEARWNGTFRNTSTVRTDTGMGACEVIFVESLQIIKSTNYIWVLISKISFYSLIGLIVLRSTMFFRS